MDEIGTTLCAFIATEVLLDEDPSSVRPDTPLVGGVIDSLGVMQVVAFLRDEYRVSFSEPDLVPENFQTVATIERLVRSKLAARDGATD
jgi:acyl carrier protein